LARELANLGVDVTVLTADSYSGHRAPYPDVNVFPMVGRWTVSQLRQIGTFLAAQNCDLVNLQYQPGIYGKRFSLFNFSLPVAIRRQGLKLVTTFHSIANPSALSPTRISARLLATLSQHIVVTNMHHWKQLVGLCASASEKVSLIPVGSNILPSVERWEERERMRIAVRRRLGISEEAILLSHFGIFYPGKGIETLLRSVQFLAESYPALKLLVFGHVRPTSEAYFESLVDLAEQLSIQDRVIWIRDCSTSEVSEHLFASDIYVVPYEDGLSTRRTSAWVGFAHGLPVVSTIGPAMAPIFEPGRNVILISPGDSHELAEALATLMSSKKKRTALADASLDLSKQVSWTSIAQQFKSLLDSQLHSGAAH
jgi:glycosyltransferase involved in cell wall biosynthesis